MPGSGYVLLTGATGLLGRYLLRDLLLSGRKVAVLVRDGAAGRAERRVAEVVSSWADSLPAPVVLTGDLRDPGLGLGPADRAWLGRACRAAVHAAANVALRGSFDGEPTRTNAAGTRELVAACESLGIAEFHHVSTAYVCGDRTGTVLESESDCGQGFRNDYERSKSEAERLVRAARRLRPTIYRPSVIVGDSRTGFTSRYHGFYRFFELAARMAEPDGGGARCLPLRLPFHGGEARNLVPVDWVSAAITRIVSRPDLHGPTYHLTTREPTPVRDMKAVVEEVLGIGGTEFVGPGEAADPNDTERTFREQVREFLPYLGGDPVFDCRGTRAALPGFDPPRVDRPMLDRLIRFAVADGWGRRRVGKPGRPAVDCADYLERHLPAAAGRSEVARLPIDVSLGLEVRGPGGGRWFCRWARGELMEVRRGDGDRADVVYRTDVRTFEAVVCGRETPQAAFLARRIEIGGSVEKGLELAAFFGRFVQDSPYRPVATTGGRRAVPPGAS